jgi:hypothetical protein
MASATTTVSQLISSLSSLPGGDIISFFHHGDKFSQQQLATLQAELAAYSSTKIGNVKAQGLIPIAQQALFMLQAAINSGSAEEILSMANQAAAAVNTVGAA